MGHYDYVTVVHEGIVRDDDADKAVLFTIDGEDEWVPRSLLDDYDDEVLIVVQWLADDRGFDYD